MSSMNTIEKLGIDIGRVIICPTVNGIQDTSFLGTSFEDAMQTPPARGSFETIASLAKVFDGNIWLVSKCGESVENKSRAWLSRHNFHEITGIPKDHLRFCRKRPQKADHAREIGLTHFIDDRIDVLKHLVGLVPNLFLFGEQEQAIPAWATHAEDWEEVAILLLEE